MFHKAKLSGMGAGGRQTYKALNKCVLDSQMDKWMKDVEWMDRRMMDDGLMDG